MNTPGLTSTLHREPPPARHLAVTAARGRLAQQVWLQALCGLLAGYALLGKGFAYLGIPPLYVGEIVLLCGVCLLLGCGTWRYVLPRPLVWSLMGLATWGVATTLPHVATYGIDSLRDAMLWGYAVFAVLVLGCLLEEPARLPRLLIGYERFVPLYLLLIPVTYVISLLELAPRWPWADVPLIDVKVGDVLVHLAGVLAWWASGAGRRPHFGWVCLLLGITALAGAASRGGLLALIAAGGVCLLFRPFSRLIWSIGIATVCGILLLAVVDVRLEVPGKDREFSAMQMIESLVSIFDNTGDSDLDGTKRWRLNWWSDIVNYTVYGEYFWSGKGFGINLADDDGYQGTQWEGQLRSPHNAHMTMLARAGVPGLAVWLLPQLLWCGLLLGCCLRSLYAGQAAWQSLFVFLLAYWAALIVRASFDVFLEGPVGGIWFWAVYGTGSAAAVIYYYCPEVLATVEKADEDSAGP